MKYRTIDYKASRSNTQIIDFCNGVYKYDLGTPEYFFQF